MSAGDEFRWKMTGILGRFLLRLWAMSSRIQTIGEEEYLRVKAKGKPVILLVWHGRLLLVPYFFRRRGIFGLVSPSRDGEIIARIGLGWGFRTIRGSGSHSMVRAWLEMKNRLREGAELIIVPDGPRGPDRVFKPGGLKLAQETGAVLQPFSFSASRKRFLQSWDQFLFFYPFSKIVAAYGRPIVVDPAMDEESFERTRLQVEQALKALDAAADSHFVKK